MSDLHIVTTRGEGHLTARERRAIAQMIERGMTAGKSTRIEFYLTPPAEDALSGGAWEVHTRRRESNDYGIMRTVSHRARFTVRQVNTESEV